MLTLPGSEDPESAARPPRRDSPGARRAGHGRPGRLQECASQATAPCAPSGASPCAACSYSGPCGPLPRGCLSRHHGNQRSGANLRRLPERCSWHGKQPHLRRSHPTPGVRSYDSGWSTRQPPTSIPDRTTGESTRRRPPPQRGCIDGSCATRRALERSVAIALPRTDSTWRRASVLVWLSRRAGINTFLADADSGETLGKGSTRRRRLRRGRCATLEWAAPKMSRQVGSFMGASFRLVELEFQFIG